MYQRTHGNVNFDQTSTRANATIATTTASDAMALRVNVPDWVVSLLLALLAVLPFLGTLSAGFTYDDKV